jgi:hypothetical protein
VSGCSCPVGTNLYFLFHRVACGSIEQTDRNTHTHTHTHTQPSNMPFRDREWEDFQRDCDFFPAYTDYIFGVDTRAEAEDEPGLHPQIFELDIWPPAPTVLPPTPPAPTPPLPAKRLYGLPQSGQYTRVSTPIPQPHRRRSSARTPSLLKRESSVETYLRTPCPAPRNLPVLRDIRTPLLRPGELPLIRPGELPLPRPREMPLLRPGDLTLDTSLSFLSPYELATTDGNVTRAWSLLNSNIPPEQKVKWMNYLKDITRQIAAKRREHQVQEAKKMHSDKQERVWDLYGQGGLTNTMWKVEPNEQSRYGLRNRTQPSNPMQGSHQTRAYY